MDVQNAEMYIMVNKTKDLRKKIVERIKELEARIDRMWVCNWVITGFLFVVTWWWVL